jgi:hypothetical protein
VDRTDIAWAQSLMAQTLGYRHEIAVLEQVVPRGEEVRCIAGGELEGDSGVLVITDKGVRFVDGGHVRWAANTADITYARCDCGAVFGTVTIATARGGVKVRRVARADGAALAEAAGGRCVRGYQLPA